MIDYELSFLIAVLSVVYTNLLTDSNMIFNGIYNWLDRKFKNDQRGKNHWLFMIIIHCEKCFAGQVAFWIFIYLHFANEKHEYDPLIHVFFVAFTILSAYILNNIIKHIKHHE